MTEGGAAAYGQVDCGLPRKADRNPQKQPARCAVWLWCVGEVSAGPVEGQGEHNPRG